MVANIQLASALHHPSHPVSIPQITFQRATYNGLCTWRQSRTLKQFKLRPTAYGNDGKLFAFLGGRVPREGTPHLQVCGCQRNAKEVEREGNGVSELDLGTQDVEGAVGSSQQVEVFFSRLPSRVPWGGGLVATTMVIFWAGFHIPVGLGGLAVIDKFSPQHSLDLQTQLLELTGTIWLIQSTLEPFGPMPDFLHFRFSKVWRDRGWFPAAVIGLVVLLLAVGATASLTQDVSNSEVGNGSSALASLLTSTPIARVAIYAAYCGVTPCLEEYVYRGFLLSSLGTYMRWPSAVISSALLFSLSHFSLPGLLSLFWVGCCLGIAYTWTGNLATSFVIHSLYNAVVLTKALIS